MNIIKIKRATLDDVPALSQLASVTFKSTYTNFSKDEDIEAYIKKTFNEQTLNEAVKDERNLFLLAFEEEQAVGYAKLIANAAPEKNYKPEEYVQLEKIYILPEVQGRKVGYQLMKDCIGLSKKEGFKAIWLGVWKENHHAIKFYEKMGFKIAGNYTFTMGDTVYDQDYWMIKRI